MPTVYPLGVFQRSPEIEREVRGAIDPLSALSREAARVGVSTAAGEACVYELLPGFSGPDSGAIDAFAERAAEVVAALEN